MSEIKVSELSVKQLKELCDTQHSCATCVYDCGVDKVVLDILSKRTIDNRLTTVSISTLVEKFSKNEICGTIEHDCSKCPMKITVQVSDANFPICLYSFYDIINNESGSEYAKLLKTGSMCISKDFVKKLGLEEVVVDGEACE